ncbi:MAG: hypothetical protein ABFS56_01490 [Pseudomonadota bacterium]
MKVIFYRSKCSILPNSTYAVIKSLMMMKIGSCCLLSNSYNEENVRERLRNTLNTFSQNEKAYLIIPETQRKVLLDWLEENVNYSESWRNYDDGFLGGTETTGAVKAKIMGYAEKKEASHDEIEFRESLKLSPKVKVKIWPLPDPWIDWITPLNVLVGVLISVVLLVLIIFFIPDPCKIKTGQIPMLLENAKTALWDDRQEKALESAQRALDISAECHSPVPDKEANAILVAVDEVKHAKAFLLNGEVETERTPEQPQQPEQQEQIQALLDKARVALKLSALTTPETDNAVKWAEEVLRIDNDNSEAEGILRDVIIRYLGLLKNNPHNRKHQRQWLKRLLETRILQNPLLDYASEKQRGEIENWRTRLEEAAQ